MGWGGVGVASFTWEGGGHVGGLSNSHVLCLGLCVLLSLSQQMSELSKYGRKVSRAF